MERLRKQKIRAKIKEKRINDKRSISMNEDKRAFSNKINGRRRRHTADKKDTLIKQLEVKVNMFRRDKAMLKMRLKRKDEKQMNTSECSNNINSGDETPSASSVLMGSVSPDAKKRAKYRLKLDPPDMNSVIRDLRLDSYYIPN